MFTLRERSLTMNTLKWIYLYSGNSNYFSQQINAFHGLLPLRRNYTLQTLCPFNIIIFKIKVVVLSKSGSF